MIPAWRAYSDLPAEVQENRRSKERGKSTRVAAHAAYKDRLEGNLVIETLLDAIHWFLRCDPRLASRTVDGELEFFPLPDLFQHRYERRHPEWPDRHEVERDILRSAVEKLPGGLGRSISHRLLDGSGERVEAYVGQTALGQGASTLFLESPDQVALDVAAGYEYRLESGAPITCGPSGSDLFVGERLLCDFSFREMDAEDEDRWRSLWHQRSRFPDLYLRDRHPG